MPSVTLVVVSPTDPRADSTRATVLQSTDEPSPFRRPKPLMRGDGGGDVDLLCGACEFAIGQQLANANQVQGMCLVCPACGAYNVTRV